MSRSQLFEEYQYQSNRIIPSSSFIGIEAIVRGVDKGTIDGAKKQFELVIKRNHVGNFLIKEAKMSFSYFHLVNSALRYNIVGAEKSLLSYRKRQKDLAGNFYWKIDFEKSIPKIVKVASAA